jgi:cyclophilin family peptidyl-prolyl cis-trans isomerase
MKRIPIQTPVPTFTPAFVAASLLVLALLLLGAAPLRAAGSNAPDAALMTVKIDGHDELLPVIITFYDTDAPQTVANFKKLARKGFYNGIAFHRVFPHMLVQAGDPLTKGKDRARIGTGGPGYNLQPEIHRKHLVGAVAAARLPDKINPGRVSSGSQFYICLKAQPNLDGQYTVFGQVESGMENLDKISQIPVDSNDNPVNLAVIKSIKIMPLDEAQRVAEKEAKQKPSKLLQFIRSVDI